jgi:hypothetical protein
MFSYMKKVDGIPTDKDIEEAEVVVSWIDG